MVARSESPECGVARRTSAIDPPSGVQLSGDAGAPGGYEIGRLHDPDVSRFALAAVRGHAPHVRRKPLRLDEDVVVFDLEGIVEPFRAGLLLGFVLCRIRDRAAIRRPREVLHPLRRTRDPARVAATHRHHKDLRPGGLAGRRNHARQKGKPIAGWRKARLAYASPILRQRARATARHVHDHEIGVVAVLLVIGPRHDDHDRLAVGRNLRVGDTNDAPEIVELHSTGLGHRDDAEQNRADKAHANGCEAHDLPQCAGIIRGVLYDHRPNARSNPRGTPSTKTAPSGRAVPANCPIRSGRSRLKLTSTAITSVISSFNTKGTAGSPVWLMDRHAQVSGQALSPAQVPDLNRKVRGAENPASVIS